MFEDLKNKILGNSEKTKIDNSLIKENDSVARYFTNILSISDSAYTCSMGARICYGLNVDKEYVKNRSHISRIVGMGHDSVSAHSNIISLIKVNGESVNGEELLNVLPALKFMNIVHLQKVEESSEEDGEPIVENYMLVSGSVRAFRYFLMEYDAYNTELNSLAVQFISIMQKAIEIEFLDKLIDNLKNIKLNKKEFTYSAPTEFNEEEIVNEKGEVVDVVLNSDPDKAGSIHFPEIDGKRVDVIYADNIVDLFIKLKSLFHNLSDEVLFKAVCDVSVVTIKIHDYSRAISQQINRHMSGISQESQRYVDYSKAQFIDPLTFDTEKYDVNKVYNVSIDGKDISGTSQEIGEKLQSVYPQLKEQGMLSQDARSFLPFNVKTKAMHTFTLTNYLHFIKVRIGKAAQPEIRFIAEEMKNVFVDKVLPYEYEEVYDALEINDNNSEEEFTKAYNFILSKIDEIGE